MFEWQFCARPTQRCRTDAGAADVARALVVVAVVSVARNTGGAGIMEADMSAGYHPYGRYMHTPDGQKVGAPDCLRKDITIRLGGLYEWMCPCGVGHPLGHSDRWSEWMGVHGCCGVHCTGPDGYIPHE